MKRTQGRFGLQLSSVLLALAATSLVSAFQDVQKNSALLPEAWARNAAIDSVLPAYPDEAVQRRVGGVVRVRFETNPEGEVV